MNLTRYSPLASQLGLHNELRQVFDRLFNETEAEHSGAQGRQWVPRVDIKEEGDRFVILADIPGLEPDEIDIQMENNVLTLRGERAAEAPEQLDRYSRVERARGEFFRRFALPITADADAISASGRNGVLEISIPKRPETQPRKIEVSGGTQAIEGSQTEH